MRNVSEMICGENRNTHFTFKNSPPLQKIVPFMRQSGKIWYIRVGHRTPDSTAQNSYSYNVQYLLIFHGNNCYAKALQC